MLLIKILKYTVNFQRQQRTLAETKCYTVWSTPARALPLRSMCQASHPDKLKNTKCHPLSSRYWKGLINFEVLRLLPGRVRVHIRLHFCPLRKEGKREEQRKQNRPALLRSRLSTLKMQSFLSGEQIHTCHTHTQYTAIICVLKQEMLGEDKKMLFPVINLQISKIRYRSSPPPFKNN